MPKLNRFAIEKTTVERLAKRELSILLGGGKILNELNMGTKYLIFSMNACQDAVHAGENRPERIAAFTALSFFLRLTAGHVFEAYEYVRNVVRVDELRKSISLPAAFDADMKRLNTYFGRKNLIREIRNKFSFHTDPDVLRNSFKNVPPEFSYEVLLGQENRGPNLFYGSESIIIIAGYQGLKQNTNWFDALKSAFMETIEITECVTTVFERLIQSIMAEHLKITMDDAEELCATDGPPLDVVVVPFFCQPPIGQSSK
jgi:hypothetical protein